MGALDEDICMVKKMAPSNGQNDQLVGVITIKLASTITFQKDRGLFFSPHDFCI
jgi:hypothetical protein